MYSTTNNAANPNPVELVGYALMDANGKKYYFVADWSNNTLTTSENPSTEKAIAQGANHYHSFDNKRIIAVFHTHPKAYFDGENRPDAYDGPSYDDYILAKDLNCPVYTLGPHTVSVMTPGLNIMYPKTPQDFINLSTLDYTYNAGFISNAINPYFRGDIRDYLRSPSIDYPFFK